MKGIKFLILSVFVFVLLINLAYAQSMLTFSDVDVKVGGKSSKNLVDGETIDDEAEPGDTVEFKIEVMNNFTSAEDLEIQDITIDVTIEEIDDGDDLDDESSEFDLRPGREKRVTLNFEVPLEVDEDGFNVLIHAEGEDENGTTHEADMDLTLDVDKETHKLVITRKTLSPAEVACGRKNVQVGVTVINIGNEDEEDVVFELSNSDLGVNIREDVGELTSEPNEEESKFLKTYSFNLPNDVEEGSYPIALKAIYDNDRRRAEETVTLTVNECLTAPKPQISQPQDNTQTTQDGVTVITPPSTAPTGATTAQPNAPADTFATEESFFRGNVFVAGVIIAEVIAVMIGVALVVSLFRRR